MKVLIAIHGFPPTYYAGSERAAERIAQWLLAHGHHVEVFTCEKLEQQTRHYSSIRWAGSYNRDQLWDVISTIDMLIIPSRRYENSPTVILEAQTFRLPVIAIRLGGIQELVQHEKNGPLFELNNVKDLQAQIRRLLDEPNLLTQLRAGISTVPTIDDEVGSIYAHYQKLIGKV